MSERELQPSGENELGPSACCKRMSRSVWSYLRNGDATEAAYFVQWTLGGVSDHGAHFDFIVGRWGEGATPADRVAACLEFRQTERGPELMVIDAENRSVSKSPLVHRGLSRAEVIDTPTAKRVFDMVDFVWAQEGRIEGITGGTTMGWNR